MMIDRLRIATPCRASWERMEGDERVRHCAECKLNVYNVAEMTRDEVRALLARSEERVCARLYRRADGTVLTRDCPRGLRDVRRRVSRAAAAIVAALLSLPAFALGGAKRGVRIHGSKVSLTVEGAATAQPAGFTGIVVYEDLALPGVTVVLRDETTGEQFTLVTDAGGAFHFTSLREGVYRAELQFSGFKTAKIEHLELKPSAITHAVITMRLDINEQFTVGVIPAEATHEPMTTTFTQSFVDKLPF